METRPLHIKSPYKKSQALSACSGFNVYIKLDNTQPAGSFKIRGIGNLCVKSAKQGLTKLVCSSGGNAGLAAAYAAQRLGKPIDIFTPQSTPQFVIEKLQNFGANVVVVGNAWDESNASAVEEAAKPGCVYVPPFDHPDIWEGHASIVDEIASDVGGCDDVAKPDLLICSVGGGGLLCGLVLGLKNRGWNDVPVLAVETEGTSSLYQSYKAGKLVTLPAITSIAKTLGAKTVAKATLECTRTHNVVPCTVSDKDTVNAITRFLDDERVLVEPACAASLAVIYNCTLRELVEAGELPKTTKNVAVVVCGGSGIKLDLLLKWKEEFGV